MALATAPAADAAMTPAAKRHLKALEGRIERGIRTFVEVGLALLEIRDKQLFRLTHTSFEAYCGDRWGMDRQRAYQLMTSAEVVQVLPPNSGIVNEAQARELVPLLNASPALVLVAAERIREVKEPLTAATVRGITKALIGDVADGNGRIINHATPVTVTAKFVAWLTKAAADARVWKASKPTAREKKQVAAAVEALVSALD